jgi:PPM family protein phosphatase
MRLRVGAATDVGKVRTRNEDSYLIDEPLFVVADGMGGHRGGDVASRLTVGTLQEAQPQRDPSGAALLDAVRSANRIVNERSASDRDLRGMGTTVTALQASGDSGRIAHVGDSRAYLLREGALQQLTQDHTLVQQMVDEGNLDADEAERHPARHIMTRALGVDEQVAVDQLTLDLHPGDRILLCSDGLTGMLSADDIRDLMERETDPQQTADALVQLAVERGGEDNVTVVIVDVESGDDAESADAAEGAAAAVGGAAAAGVAPASDAAAPIDGDGGAPPARGGSTTQVIARAEARAMTEAEAPAPAPAAPRKRLRWKRLALWIGAVVFVVVAAWVGVRLYVDHQWYVGVEDGRVAVFQGIPAKPLGFTLSHPEDVTDIPASVAVRLQPWRGLDEGITVNTRNDAEALVEQIRTDVASLQSVSGPAG